MKFKIRKGKNNYSRCFSQDIITKQNNNNNLDLIIYGKMDSILNQQKQNSAKKFTAKKISEKYNHITHRRQQMIHKRITLEQLLIENEKKKEMLNIIGNDKNANNNNDLDMDIYGNIIRNGNVKHRTKKENTSYFKKRIPERKSIETLRMNLENNDGVNIFLNRADKIKAKRKIGRRYTLFKTILNYLESNNITLYEFLKNNPFQNKPYELSNSYEFLSAIKYKNYNYITQALQYNKKYLFSFDYYGQTAYHWAAKLGDIKMLKLLLEFGLFHNQKDFKGRTPLYLAAVNNHKEICNFLLANNGNIFLKDKNGLGPSDVAGSKELKFFLIDFMNQPFSNPIYKARIQAFLKEREEKIKIKAQKEEEERRKKERKVKEKEEGEEEEEQEEEKEKEKKENNNH
jgi:hypothetical protein